MRGDAFGQERREARRAFLEQLLLTRGAHRAHGREDAATGARDLLVGAPAQPLGVFIGAVTGEHQVRVAVDEPGRHPAPPPRSCSSSFLPRPRRERRRQRRLLPHPLDAAAAREQRAVGEGAARRIAGGEPRVAPEFQRCRARVAPRWPPRNGRFNPFARAQSIAIS